MKLESVDHAKKSKSGTYFYGIESKDSVRICGRCGSVVVEQFIERHDEWCNEQIIRVKRFD